MNNTLEKIAYDVYQTAVAAGEAILPYYEKVKDLELEYKEDDSPLTAADMASHAVIERQLAHYVVYDKTIPILSEEGEAHSLAEKLSWQSYWCVDPLDGTKEFVKGHSEFTVNIALIEQHQPIIGVIYAPALKIGYMAWKKGGAYYCHHELRERIQVKTPVQEPLRVIASRRHGVPQIEAILNQLPSYTLMSRGSALKFCGIARGEADLFLRTTQTGEWDNAAGQCIVEEAGGAVFHFDLSPVRYNNSLSYKTNPIIVVGDTSFAWQSLLSE